MNEKFVEIVINSYLILMIVAKQRLFCITIQNSSLIGWSLFVYTAHLLSDVGPPRNFAGEVRSANSIQLTWAEPLSETGGDRIASYELYYNDTHFRQNVRVSIAPTYSSYLLTDLTPATVYHLRLAARTSRDHEGPSSDMIQLQTFDYGQTCACLLT